MPLQIPTFSLKDIKNFPYQVLILLLIITNAYFINRNDGNSDESARKLEKAYNQRDSIAGKYFDVLIQNRIYDGLVRSKNEALRQRDSLLRIKTEKPAKEIINRR